MLAASDLTLVVAGLLTLAGSAGVATIVVRLLNRENVAADTARVDATRVDIITQATERAVALVDAQLERAIERIDELEAMLRARDLTIERQNERLTALELEAKRLRDAAG